MTVASEVAPRLRAKALAAAMSLTAFALVTPEAHAEPRDTPAAEVLFRQGRNLMVAGQYEEACPKFAESLRLEHAPGTLLNLADCEEHVGKTATAWAHFRELAREVSAQDERQPLALERAAALEHKLARLTIRSSPLLSSDRRVLRDDVEIGPTSFDLAVPVDPGRHVVVVMDGDRVLYRAEVRVSAAQSRAVGPEDFASVASPVSRGPWIAGWITGGAGMAALATGAGFGIAALVNQSAANAHCAAGVCSDAASAGTYDAARTEARVADVALGIGAAATLAAGYLLFFAAKPHTSDAPAPPPVLAALSTGRITF